MNDCNENAFFAYYSLYSDYPHWRFWFHHSKEVAQLPIGVIVFYFLNRINRVKGDGQIDFSKYVDLIPKDFDHVHYDVNIWRVCYDNLLEILEHLSGMKESEKHRAYKKYCQLAYFLVNNFDWEEWVSYADSCEKADEIVNKNYKLPEVIAFRGNRVDTNGTPYACYEVAGFEYLFILDLWELMFNPNAKIIIKQCEHCSDFFFTITNQKKYCFDCSEPKKYNRIKNAKQKKDESKRIYKLITDIFYRRDEKSPELQAFLNENQYYKDILNGKKVEPNPEYLNIQSKEEYLSWLKAYHASLIRKRGRKNGKTNETSERNGSDS